MNGDTRFERQLPEILADLGAGRSPDYTDLLLARTAGTRQRPGWVFPERWLPMSALTQRMAAAPRLPRAAVIVVALLVLALVSAAIYVGSHQRHVPAPFGPAANGVIPYVANGEIHVGDPVSGQTRLLVTGLKNPAMPQFSPDGTRLAFYAESAAGDNPIDVYVVRDDGSDLRKITPAPIWSLKELGWTPDGSGIVVVSNVDAGHNNLDIYDAGGTAPPRTIASLYSLDMVMFRPPDGRSLLFRTSSGLYTMSIDGTNVRPVVTTAEPGSNDFWGGAAWSADGNRIFYTRPLAQPSPTGTCCSLWVMNADGSDQRPFVPNDGASWDGQPYVSPDGKLVAFWGGGYVSVAPADGNGPVTHLGDAPSGTVQFLWSPDSTELLMMPNDGSSPNAFLLDPAGGPTRHVPWASDLDLGWQRIAGS